MSKLNGSIVNERCFFLIHYKKIVSELTETGPNEYILIDRKLIENWQIVVNLDKFLSIRTFFYKFGQISVNFLSIRMCWFGPVFVNPDTIFCNECRWLTKNLEVCKFHKKEGMAMYFGLWSKSPSNCCKKIIYFYHKVNKLDFLSFISNSWVFKCENKNIIKPNQV